jgi:hypothetical protein
MNRGFIRWGVTVHRDGWMQLTPLCGPKIVAILKPGIGPTAFLIYRAARLMGRPFGGFCWHGNSQSALLLNSYEQCAPRAADRGTT